MEKLAIDGGKPVRTSKIFYGRQWIDEDDIRAVNEVLRSDFLTCGPKIEELKNVITSYTGAKYATVVSNGTAALHCACIAAGLGPGDEVITTPITFAASANCILYVGAKPVFADIDPLTYNISPDSILEKITKKTKAVIAVDYTGQSVDHEAIRKICNEHGLLLIEDAAHAIGTSYKNKKIGSIADLTTFSFHPVKTITSGEGGAITTNSKEMYDKLVLAGTHGIVHDGEKMENMVPDGPWYYEQVMLGYNYRLTDFQAALLVNQFGKLEDFKRRRKEISKKYIEAFSSMSGIILQNEIDESDTCRHLFVIRLDMKKLSCSRREFFDAMSAENVQCQVHYIPVYWFPYYQKLGYKKGICPNAEKLYAEMMSIPFYPKMSDEDVQDVIRAVEKVTKNFLKED